MKPVLKAFTISILTLAVTLTLSLSADATTNRGQVSGNVRPSVTVNEQRPERNINHELMDKIDRNGDYSAFENKKLDTQKLMDSLKDLSDEEKLRKLNSMIDNPMSIPTTQKTLAVSKQIISTAKTTVPLSADDERKQYVQDLNWKTTSNVQAKVATANISKLPLNQKPMDRKRFMDEKRHEMNNRLQDLQTKLKDRNKYYTDRGLRDPYADSLIRQILADIKKAYHDVEESQLHPDQAERWIPILEEDLQILARDQAELDHYTASGSIIRKTTGTQIKGPKS